MPADVGVEGFVVVGLESSVAVSVRESGADVGIPVDGADGVAVPLVIGG